MPHAGGHFPPLLAPGESRITLGTAEGTDLRHGWTPQRTGYLAAKVQGKSAPAPPGRLSAVPDAEQAMNGWSTFLATLDGIPEGNGTLLDNTIVFAHSDTQFARAHTIEGIPMMIAGTGGGRIRSGMHMAGNGEPVTRVGLTLQQVMRVPVTRWGAGSMETSKTLTEIVV